MQMNEYPISPPSIPDDEELLRAFRVWMRHARETNGTHVAIPLPAAEQIFSHFEAWEQPTPPSPPSSIDPKFFNEVAQTAHFFTTYAISFTCAMKWGWKGWVVATIGIWIYAVWHEFFYDPRKENAATRGSDLEDFIWLVSGPLVAAVAAKCI